MREESAGVGGVRAADLARTSEEKLPSPYSKLDHRLLGGAGDSIFAFACVQVAKHDTDIKASK
eukprot:1886606-Pleurochrysis_carterae.AAC.5